MTAPPISATSAYRNKIALAAMNGTAVPRISHLAWGSGTSAYDPAGDSPTGEFARVAAAVDVDGVELTATATLTGTMAGANVLRWVAGYAQDGTLVGRKILAPKSFEPETEMDFELTFQF